MKTIISRLFTIALLALLTACSKKPVEVRGQIFVITQGRENMKMGGVNVLVIPDKEFVEAARKTLSWMQEEVRREAQRNADSDYETAFIREVLKMEKEALNSIAELPAIRTAIVEESGGVEGILESLAAAPILQRSLVELASAVSKPTTTTTDADGRFTVSITGKTWFLATGERSVGDNTEQYHWVKNFEASAANPNTTVVISNDSDIDTEDELYLLLTSVSGAPGELEEIRKVEVSEKMKALVERHRKAVYEAKAKAEHERTEALTKAERERAEAMSKLQSAIQIGAIGKTLDIPLPGGSLLRMAYCPAGSFKMGSPVSEEGRSSDENQIQVRISDAFWLGKTEITQAQWRAVMGENPSYFKGDDLPVEIVSWDDAQEFIKKVNAAGILPTGWKFALPNEAQWEYACRAGDAGAYSGGTIDQVAWYEDNSARKTHDVGTKKANAWGLHDMHGNVWEWCADWYGDELTGGTDPTGASSGVNRVFRGGSWGDDAATCRAANRLWFNPGYRNLNLGFRPALVPSE